MRRHGLCGAQPGRKRRWLTVADDTAARPADLVARRFVAERPNELWVCDLSYLKTREGFIYLAFVLDVFSRMIVGWQTATHLKTELVLDALEMAVHLRQPAAGELVAHTDRGSQGGFERSLQRSIRERCDGHEVSGLGTCGSAVVALAGTSAGGPVGASAAVLGDDRSGRLERGGRRGGRRVGSGWCPVVSGGWRHADRHAGRAVGAVPVIR